MDKIKLNQFEIQPGAAAIIGTGGMGTVYKGVDTATGQVVAIKQLRPELVREHPDQVERFNREAQALGVLNHPNIVKVLDSIQQGESHYIIMEFVNGGSLRDLLDKQEQISVEWAMQVALDLADALTRAHRMKIIHRDIKPANVLLAEDGTPRLTDFGVARMDGSTGVTKTGTVVGTLNYLSPEALNGETLDERADIWAFGVMLYEMLAGRRPFMEESTGGLITAILTKQPPGLAELRPDLPETLVLLVDRMLIKDRDLRLDSIRRVGVELESIIRGTDSSEFEFDTELKRNLSAPQQSRFITDTPTAAPEYTFTGPGHIKTENGQEYLLLPKSFDARRIVIGGVLMALLTAVLVVALLGFAANNRDRGPMTVSENNGPPSTALPSPPTSEGQNQQAIAFEAPQLADNEYLVLVTESNIGESGDPDMVNAVVRDLRDTLEIGLAFSNIRVAEYPAAVRGPDAAREIGEEHGAALVIGGGSRDGTAMFNIELGDLSVFDTLAFDLNELDRLTRLQIFITEPTQSITPYVLNVLSTLHIANGNVFEFMRTLALLEELSTAEIGRIENRGVSADLARFYNNYLVDLEFAAQAIENAIEADSGNALLYVGRALVKYQIGDDAQVQRDLTTADRIGPDNWATPDLLRTALRADMLETDTQYIEQALAIRPDDWFYHYLYGDMLYVMGDLEAAQTALNRSIDLGPQANYPYITSFFIALRQERIRDAGAMLQIVVEEYPDPNFGDRILSATFGEEAALRGKLNTATANLIIGQVDVTIEETDAVINFMQGNLPESAEGEEILQELEGLNHLSDLFLVRGLAFCTAGEHEDALDSYSIGLTLDHDYYVLRLLRLRTLLELGQDGAVDEDLELVTGRGQVVDNLLENTRDGEFNCQTFFDYFIDQA